ncbi:hypothetical protein [Streptomyces chartreusis]
MSDDSVQDLHTAAEECIPALEALGTAFVAPDRPRQEQASQVRILTPEEWAGAFEALRRELHGHQLMFGNIHTQMLSEVLAAFGIALPGADPQFTALYLPGPPCTDADVARSYVVALRSVRSYWGAPVLGVQAACGVLDRILTAVGVRVPTGMLHLAWELHGEPVDYPDPAWNLRD